MLARSPFTAGACALTRDLPGPVAAALREAILLDTIDAVTAGGWPLHLFVAPAAEREAVAALIGRDRVLAARAPQIRLHPQTDGDAGVAMADAVARTLAAGHDVAVLVRADVPDLPPNALRAGVEAVAGGATGATLAFGPAAGGGFYLAAASGAAALAAAFSGVSWGAPGVLDAVTRRAEAAGGRVRRVLPWHGLETRDDLAALVRRAAVTGRAPRVARVAGEVFPA